VITKALMTLVHGVETKFDGEMVAMTRVPWATIESVGDQSEYDLFESFYVTSSDNIHFVCYKAVIGIKLSLLQKFKSCSLDLLRNFKSYCKS
jgi:hypothetical protein